MEGAIFSAIHAVFRIFNDILGAPLEDPFMSFPEFEKMAKGGASGVSKEEAWISHLAAIVMMQLLNI